MEVLTFFSIIWTILHPELHGIKGAWGYLNDLKTFLGKYDFNEFSVLDESNGSLRNNKYNF